MKNHPHIIPNFGARMLDSATPTWTTPDPLAEKYPSISPYAHCANNPVKFIDPDGRDYNVVVNQENKTKTISATYYTQSQDVAKANESAKYWNSQESVVNGYTVKFDLKIKNVGQESVENKVINDTSGMANSFSITNETPIGVEANNNVSGTTVENKFIYIKPDKMVSTTGAHEMGHTLGLDHWAFGIMTERGNDPLRNESFHPLTVETIILDSDESIKK